MSKSCKCLLYLHNEQQQQQKQCVHSFYIMVKFEQFCDDFLKNFPVLCDGKKTNLSHNDGHGYDKWTLLSSLLFLTDSFHSFINLKQKR